MNVAALQKLDRWLGAPLCFFLTLVRRLMENKVAAAATAPRSILFIKLAEQGSTVLAYPAIRRAVEMVERESVYFLVFDDNRFILDVLEIVPQENVIGVRHEDAFSLAGSALRALRRVRRLEVDAVVDMEFFARSSAALTFLTGARWRVGFHPFYGAGPYRGDLMTHRLLYNPHLHTAQTFQLMVEALRHDPATLPTFGVAPPPTELALPQFSPRPGEREEMQALLCRQAGQGTCPPLILLNPNAGDLLPLRKWPGDRYVDLARRLLARYPEIYVAMTGAPGEQQAIENLVRDVGSTRCFSLAGKTTLRQLLVLYTLAEVLVTNDSGPAHFASLTPVHVVTLFGPETPALYAARTSRNVPLWAGIACSPCINAYNNRQSPCQNNLCMQAITVAQVFGATCCAYEQKRKIQPAPNS